MGESKGWDSEIYPLFRSNIYLEFVRYTFAIPKFASFHTRLNVELMNSLGNRVLHVEVRIRLLDVLHSVRIFVKNDDLEEYLVVNLGGELPFGIRSVCILVKNDDSEEYLFGGERSFGIRSVCILVKNDDWEEYL